MIDMLSSNPPKKAHCLRYFAFFLQKSIYEYTTNRGRMQELFSSFGEKLWIRFFHITVIFFLFAAFIFLTNFPLFTTAHPHFFFVNVRRIQLDLTFAFVVFSV